MRHRVPGGSDLPQLGMRMPGEQDPVRRIVREHADRHGELRDVRDPMRRRRDLHRRSLRSAIGQPELRRESRDAASGPEQAGVADAVLSLQVEQAHARLVQL